MARKSSHLRGSRWTLSVVPVHTLPVASEARLPALDADPLIYMALVKRLAQNSLKNTFVESRLPCDQGFGTVFD